MKRRDKAWYETQSHWQVQAVGGLSFAVKQIVWSMGAYNDYGLRLLRRRP